MRKLIVMIWACCLSTAGFAQTTKFLNALDAEKQPNPELVREPVQWQVFLSDSRLDQQVDLLDIDEDLLNAAVFHTINKFRKRFRREPLVFTPELDKLAQNYQDFFSSYSFNKTPRNIAKLNKVAQFAARVLGYRPRLVDVAVEKANMLDYSGRPFFYNRRDEMTDLHLFYGRREDMRDTAYVPEPLVAHTYRSSALEIVRKNFRGSNSQRLRSRAYSHMSVRVQLDDKTLFKNAIPQGNLIFVLGGYRTQDYKMRKTGQEIIATE